MSSGFGLSGGPGRCYPLWMEFSSCMSKTDDPKKECKPLRDDYLECLHHRKEFQRMNIIYREYMKQQQGGGEAPASGHH